jgi:hypothetical protein
MALIILIAFVMFFNTSKAPMNPKIDKISEFKITQISGNGNIYQSKQPLNRKHLSLTDRVDIKNMNLNSEQYLMSDSHTAFEFYCFGTAFTVLPGSYLYYMPQTKEIWFYNGEFYWHVKSKTKKVDIFIRGDVESTDTSPQQSISLSTSGRARISPNWIRIWNYTGKLTFNYGSDTRELEANQHLIYRKNNRVEISRLFASPGTISPENKVVSLKEPGSSVVNFSWKVVRGAPRYIFRLYPSNLMENILFEKDVPTPRFNLDLLQFEDFGEFYWQVFAYDPMSNREGSPSAMGYLKLVGALLNKEMALKPPELKIKTLDANGNLVLIEGETDMNATLYINDVLVTVNMDGTFIHTINFEKIGRNRILFKIISPSGIETIVEKFATTYDE